MKTLELLEELNITLGDEMEDFVNSGMDEISDYCHQTADGDEDVIYYSKAEALYNNASSSERDEAEDTVEDCGGFGKGKTMADRFTVLAYWITYNRLSQAIREQAETLIEELEEQAENASVRRKWGVVIEETIEVLETI